jgi:GDPmannose 4,6-dehydratase
MGKIALITGITGQDGTYLAENLLAKGYQVIGTSHTGAFDLSLPQIDAKVKVEHLDLTSSIGFKDIIQKVRPDEIYNLAARSSSAQLFDDPVASAEINGVSVVRLLEAIREVSPCIRFCQAASSEVFVGGDVTPQDENTPCRPVNAYGAAKTYAINIIAAYRMRYKLFAVSAILFNHESPRRGLEYVTRKISHAVANIDLGREKELRLVSLESRRDWGFAGDYVNAMWMMLQQPMAEDFVIATGRTHSVREFCQIAFNHVGLNYIDYVNVDPDYAGRTEVIELCGNPIKAKIKLNWSPSIGFAELVKMMVDEDISRLKYDANNIE